MNKNLNKKLQVDNLIKDIIKNRKEKLPIVNYDDTIKQIIDKNEIVVSSKPCLYGFSNGYLSIIGPSGCGKSNLLLNIINNYCYCDKLLVVLKQKSEDKYLYLQQIFEKVIEVKNKLNHKNKKLKLDDVFKIIDMSNIDELPDINTYFDKQQNNVIIFDDLQNIKDKKLNNYIEMCFRGARKMNVFCVFLAQQYSGLNKHVFNNSNTIIVFKPTNNNERKLLCQNLQVYSFDKMKNIFQNNLKSKHDFITIRNNEVDENKKITKGLTGKIII